MNRFESQMNINQLCIDNDAVEVKEKKTIKARTINKGWAVDKAAWTMYKSDYETMPLQGKKPVIPNWQKQSGMKPRGTQNYGVLTGKKSNLTVLDIDCHNSQETKNRWLKFYQNQHLFLEDDEEPITEESIVHTGSGGMHIYFEYMSGYTNSSKITIGEKTYEFDVKNDRGQVVGPWSIHPETKKPYISKCLPPKRAKCPLYVRKTFFPPKVDENILSDDILELVENIREYPENLWCGIINTYTLSKNQVKHKDLEGDEIMMLLNGLDDSRYSVNNRESVVKIAHSLMNSLGENGLDTFISACLIKSDAVQMFSTEEIRDWCTNLYTSCQVDSGVKQIKLGSLFHWLKEDDPDLFLKLTKKNAPIEFKPVKQFNAPTGPYFEDYYHLPKETSSGSLERFFKKTVAVFPSGSEMYYMLKQMDGYKIVQKLPENREFQCEKKTTAVGILSGLRNRIYYKGIRFMPIGNNSERPSAEILNKFRGFKAEQVDEVGDCTFWLDHIRDIICSGDMDLYYWVISWFANIIQNPEDKQGTAMVWAGSSHGAGKNIAINFFTEYCLGSQYTITINNSDRLRSNFNGWLEESLLVVADESAYHGDIKTFNILKNLITQKEEMVYEDKYMKPWYGFNYSRFIFCSNEQVPVYIEKSDRRYCCLSVSSSKVGDHDYFDNFIEQCTPANGRALFEYLQRVNTYMDNLKRAPETQFKRELIEISADPFTQLIQNIRDGEVTNIYIRDGYALVTSAYVLEEMKNHKIKWSHQKTKASMKNIGIEQESLNIDRVKTRCYRIKLDYEIDEEGDI